jgi:hypothetical protein
VWLLKTRILLTFVAIWLIVPTGTPDDVITFAIIAAIGLQAYILLLLLVLLGLWYYNVTWAKMNGYTRGAKKELKKRLRL